MRDDAHLKYLYAGEQKPGRGRSRKYDGKVDYRAVKTEHFQPVALADGIRDDAAFVYAVALKRSVSVVSVTYQ